MEDLPLLNLATRNDLEGNPVDALFWQLLSNERLTHVFSSRWPTDVTDLDGLGEPELIDTTGWGVTAVYRGSGAGTIHVARVTLEGGDARIKIASLTEAGVKAARKRLVELLPESLPTDEEVPVSFWTYGMHGPAEYTRRITAASWSAIAANYPIETRARLEAMMDGFTPAHGGQLILWQGEPGTGKTWALRALAWEWRQWARFHYIADPDQMLGSHADYLTQVLLSYDSGEAWRVLVLEDSGELLAADAKQQTGQALSRLLNVVDGLLGQGLKVLVLVTTNEELRTLHPAVARPGRCAAKITFDRFTVEDAAAWLDDHELGDVDIPNRGSLAELYALKDGYALEPATAGLGFSR